MENYIEIDFTKEEKRLLTNYSESLAQGYKFIITTPKICISIKKDIKTIQICPNEHYWAIPVYRTKRQKPISEKEAHRKTLKLLKILNGLSGL